MNVYDKSHELATAIKDSQEFKDYDTMKKTISTNPELEAMIKDFQGKQFEMQAKQMVGEEMDADFTQEIQRLYQIIVQDPMAAQYMQAEMRFSLMINDVYKILGEAMGISK